MLAYNQESQVRVLFSFFAKHPGIMISIAYMLLTLSGIFYSHSFYSEFNISILKLADISDLLIAGISDPAATVMFSGGILIAVLTDMYIAFSYTSYNNWKTKPKSLLRKVMLFLTYTPKRRVEVVFAILVMFVLYAFIFVSLYAEWRSDKIKSGSGDKVILHTKSSNETNTVSYLLGSTTNYVITYNKETQLAKLTPVENIEYISPLPAPSETVVKKSD